MRCGTANFIPSASKRFLTSDKIVFRRRANSVLLHHGAKRKVSDDSPNPVKLMTGGGSCRQWGLASAAARSSWITFCGSASGEMENVRSQRRVRSEERRVGKEGGSRGWESGATEGD